MNLVCCIRTVLLSAISFSLKILLNLYTCPRQRTTKLIATTCGSIAASSKCSARLMAATLSGVCGDEAFPYSSDLRFLAFGLAGRGLRRQTQRQAETSPGPT